MRSALLFLAAASLMGQQRGPSGDPGKFDYYLLALSWSPAFCEGPSGARNVEQCGPGRKFAFVLHGLWPQNERGRWPEDCSNAPGLRDPRQMLDIMPAVGLIRHEWQKHGTCSGLDADGYFALARKAFQSVKIPAKFQAPKEYLNITPQEVQQEFLKANAGWSQKSLSVQCSAQFLSEVRICLDKGLKAMACPDAPRGCRAEKVRMPPVR
ncbi:MAG: ribonuclease T2 [Acidobacteria bacterium]|nr:ribonuclease T2 [Acidobacteriota bacterium]